MKLHSLKGVLFLWLLAVVPLLVFGNDKADSQLTQANKLYAKAQYQHALDIYKALISQGYQSADLYYNTGNASYKTGDLPSALLYFEKARKLKPNDEDIQANIRFVNARTTDRIEELPEFFLSKWWNSVILGWSLTTLAAWSLILIFVAAGLLMLYFFAHAKMIKRAAFYLSVALFIIGLFTLFLGNRQLAYLEHNKQAIVFSSTVTVKAEPSAVSKSLFVIHEGAKVLIAEQNNGWTKVRLVNGNEGWIKSAEFKEI